LKERNLKGSEEGVAVPYFSISTSYTYNERDQLTLKSYNDGVTPSVYYSYNKDWRTSVCTNNSTCSGNNAYQYTAFDGLGRVLSSKQTTNGSPYQFHYTYNLADGIISTTLPSGRVVNTTYDVAGRPSSVAGTFNSTQTTYVTSASYAPQSAVQQLILGNGLTEVTAYNGRLQPTQIQMGNAAANTLSLQFGYGIGTDTSHNNGNVYSQVITRPSLGTWTQSYGYDGLNRLTAASETGTGSWSENYGYDFVGNRWVTNPLITTAETPLAQSWYNSSTNHITSWGYDAAGNVNSVGAMSRTFTYDAENRQILATINGATTTYQYDGDGQRVQKVAPAGTTTYVYDASGYLAAEYSNVTPPSTGTSYLTGDHLGSTRLVTNSIGSPESCYDYLPFGQQIPNSVGRSAACFGNPDLVTQKFTAMERDPETGIDFFQARYLSSAEGRFTSPDAPFNDQNPADPQSWNLFSYVRNNPLAYTDPTGTTTCLVGTDGVARGSDGGPCGTESVTVTATGDPMNDFLLMAMLNFLTPIAQSAAQIQQAASHVVTAIDSFRNDPNCAAVLIGAGTAAGALVGGAAGAAGGGTGGFFAGSVVPVAGNIAGAAGGAALGWAGGALAGGSAGGAVAGIGGAFFCNGNAKARGGGGGGSGKSGASAGRKLSNAAEANRVAQRGGFRDAHDLKEQIVGARGAQYDMYQQPNGDIELFAKNGVGEGIETGLNVKR
jgi:RHS repeat-associated protein